MLTLEAELNEDWMYCVNESLAGTDAELETSHGISVSSHGVFSTEFFDNVCFEVGRVIGTVEFDRRVTVLSTSTPVYRTYSATFRFLTDDPTPQSPNVSSSEISSSKISSSPTLDILQHSLMEGSTLIFGSR